MHINAAQKPLHRDAEPTNTLHLKCPFPASSRLLRRRALLPPTCAWHGDGHSPNGAATRSGQLYLDLDPDLGRELASEARARACGPLAPSLLATAAAAAGCRKCQVLLRMSTTFTLSRNLRTEGQGGDVNWRAVRSGV